MNEVPAFEDANDRFLGLTKTQFTMIAALMSMLAAALAGLSIGAWAWTAAQRRADFCQAVDTTNAAIRKVLTDGINQGEAELKDPKFAKYRPEIRKAIRKSIQYRAELFANRPC